MSSSAEWLAKDQGDLWDSGRSIAEAEGGKLLRTEGGCAVLAVHSGTNGFTRKQG